MKHKLINVKIYATFSRKEVKWGMRTIWLRLLLDNIFQIQYTYTQQQVHHAGKEVLLKIKIKKKIWKSWREEHGKLSGTKKDIQDKRDADRWPTKCTDEKHQNRDTYIYTHTELYSVTFHHTCEGLSKMPPYMLCILKMATYSRSGKKETTVVTKLFTQASLTTLSR